MAASSQTLGPQLLRLLGIDSSRCRKAVITLEFGCAVVVDVETYADEPKDGELEMLAQRYVITAELNPDHPQEWVEVSTLCSQAKDFVHGKQLPTQDSCAD